MGQFILALAVLVSISSPSNGASDPNLSEGLRRDVVSNIPTVIIQDALGTPDQIQFSMGKNIILCRSLPKEFYLVNRSSFLLGFRGNRMTPQEGELAFFTSGTPDSVFIQTAVPSFFKVFYNREKPIYLKVTEGPC